VDGSDRLLKFVIPVIIDRIAQGKSIWLSVSIIASFAYYLNQVDENGGKIEIVDRQKEILMRLSDKLNKNSNAIIEAKDLFSDVVENPTFASTFCEVYEKIKKDGSKSTLVWLLEKTM
jgi:mannitol 2-dehydrogenase